MTPQPTPALLVFLRCFRSLILVSCISGVLYAGDDTEANKFVRVHAEITQSTLQQGQQGELSILFTPIDGIHITSDPAMKIDIDSKGPFRPQGKPREAVDSSTGYLSSDEPVMQVFNVSPRAPTGQQRLKANITYYFCSDDEGWCRKFVQTIDLPVQVEKPAAHKR